MDKRNIGLILVMVGNAFLMVSFSATTTSILWIVSLSSSIILNIIAIVILMQYLDASKEREKNT